MDRIILFIVIAVLMLSLMGCSANIGAGLRAAGQYSMDVHTFEQRTVFTDDGRAFRDTCTGSFCRREHF
jgi:hypothetical protein